MNKKMLKFWRRLITLAVATVILAAFGTSIQGQDTEPTEDTTEEAVVEEAAVEEEVAFATVDDVTGLKLAVDSTWLLLTAFLVFFMQAGFALLEAGLIRHTGVVNALLENFMDAGLTGVCWWAIGYGLAFGTSAGGFIGTDNFFLSGAVDFGPDGVTYATFGALNVTVLAFFFFQFAFAATASTIATGGMAERTDFIGDIIYSALIALFIYPVIVHWVWGGGWLSTNLGFHDFAGSTVVHTVGGVIALLGAIMLGPRPGRVFGNPPKPHNMALATIGTMILWFGWYGFNPGSTLGAFGYDGLMALASVNTTLAAAAAALASMFFVYFRTGKWDLTATLNGSLAGLVGITAGCGFVSPVASFIIGITAGIVVVIVADIIEAAKIDDCVGAFAVHGACGILGTIAVGLWAQPQLLFSGPFAAGGAYAGQGGLFTTGSFNLLIAQVIGSGATIVWVAVCSIVMFGALKAVNRLRVDPKADVVGIDVYEHGVSAWPDVLPLPDEGVSGSGRAATSPATGD